jgi:hypothetical protein
MLIDLELLFLLSFFFILFTQKANQVPFDIKKWENFGRLLIRLQQIKVR